MIDKPSAPDNVPSDRSTPSGTVVAITFMLFQTLIVWYAIRDNFFKDDDWLVLYRAEEMGLTWRFLALDVYQHFAPVNRFIYWISQHYAPGNWPLARSLIGACLFLWLVSVWTCCRVARTSLPRTLVALAPVGLSVFTAFPALWFGCAAHVFPAAAGSAFTVALFLWWHRSGGWVPLALAWFAFAATLLTQERPLIVFPYLLLLHYLVLAPGPLRRIPARVIRDWRIWTGFAAIWVGYFAYFMRVYYGPLPRPRLSQLLGFLVFTIGRFASGLAGLRSLPPFVWRADTIMDDVAGAAAALILAACAGWTIHRNRWNARVWAFFIFAFMGNMAMLGWGRVGVFGIEGVGGNLQYYCDICMLLAWSVALLRAPSDGAPWVPRLAPYPIVRGVLLAACGTALIATNAVSWGGLLRENYNARRGRRWFETARRELQSHAGASALPYALLGSKVPYVAADFIDPFNRLPNVLTVMTRVPPSNDASPERRIIDGDGRVVPVQAQVASTVQPIERVKTGAMSADHAAMEVDGDQVCITAQAGGSVSVRLPAPVSAPSLVAELTFSSSQDVSLTVAATNGARWWYSPTRTTLRAARGRALAWLDPGSADGLALAGLSPGRFCLERLVLATPHYPPDSQGRCASVDVYGLPGPPVACGMAWLPSMP